MPELKEHSTEQLFELIKTPDDRRFFAVMELLSRQETVETIHETTKIDLFFLHVFKNMITLEQELKNHQGTLSKDTLRKVKEKGFLDETIASLTDRSEQDIRQLRQEYGIAASFKIVDTCAAEFDAKRITSIQRTLAKVMESIKRKQSSVHSSLAPVRFELVRELSLIIVPFTAFLLYKSLDLKPS